MDRRNDALRPLAVLSALLLGGAYVAYSSGVASISRKSPQVSEDVSTDTLMLGSKSAPIFEDEAVDPGLRTHHEILMQTTKSGRIFRSPQDPVSNMIMRSSKVTTIEHPFVEMWDKVMGPPGDAPLSESPEIAPTP